MNNITRLIIVVLFLFALEMTGTNFAEAATPNVNNRPVPNARGNVNRNSRTGLAQRPKNVRSKNISTGKSVHQNKAAAKTFQNTSPKNTKVKSISKGKKLPLGHSKNRSAKTSKSEKNLPAAKDKSKRFQQEKRTFDTSHSSNDLKYGLKEGLKYGLKYGEKK